MNFTHFTHKNERKLFGIFLRRFEKKACEKNKYQNLSLIYKNRTLEGMIWRHFYDLNRFCCF